MNPTHSKFIPLAICLALVLAACSSDSAKSTDVTTTVAATAPATDAPATTAPAASAPATTPATAAPQTSAPAACVEAVENADTVNLVHLCGTILTDSGDLTLYTFDADPLNGSACNAGCVDTWPPLTIPDGDFTTALPDGFDEIARDDGLSQLTYLGKPLYRYSGDSAPGDTNGDGIGGVWHVVPLGD